eukprot:scaffold3359_cov48-Phaeocystis_antarctica.AAC.1
MGYRLGLELVDHRIDARPERGARAAARGQRDRAVERGAHLGVELGGDLLRDRLGRFGQHAQVEEDLVRVRVRVRVIVRVTVRVRAPVRRDAGERLVLLAHARLQQRVRLVGVRVGVRLRVRLRVRVGVGGQWSVVGAKVRVRVTVGLRLLAQPGARLPQEGHLLVHEGDAAQVGLAQYLLGLVDRERHLVRVGVGVGGWGW